MPSMKVEFATQIDAAYITLVEGDIQPGEATTTVELVKNGDPMGIMVDFADDGRMLGIEVLGADKRLPDLARTEKPSGIDYEARSRIMYSTDGNGRWWKREWAKQCPHMMLLDRCQGTENHTNQHWCYRNDGSYSWAINRSEVPEVKSTDAVMGMTPPGNPGWISPIDRAADYHYKFFVDSEVTDPVLLAKLEADDPNNEVDGSINRPCTDEEINELQEHGRLPSGWSYEEP